MKGRLLLTVAIFLGTICPPAFGAGVPESVVASSEPAISGPRSTGDYSLGDETNEEKRPFWRIGTSHPDDRARAASELLAELDAEQRVSQLFLVGWQEPPEGSELLEWIGSRGLGGIKIFGWNGNDLPELARQIRVMQQAAAGSEAAIPLFTATDQEGGWVRHVRGSTSITPGNMALGASDLAHDAYRTAAIIGRELRSLGINMNFAPTVDVYVNPEAHVIGPRAFSDDPVQSGTLGVAFFHGLENARVIATAKHFPGHGNAAGDSHLVLPRISDDYETLWNRDLVPYRQLIREGVPAVLSGHLNFPRIYETGEPASLSPFFKTEVLREELGFEGIVVTDDLYMDGALEYGRASGLDLAELSIRAVEAGNDLIMLSRTPSPDGPIFTRMLERYQESERFRTRVDESVERILRIKLEYLHPDDRVPLAPEPDNVERSLPDSESAEFFRSAAARSVTLIADRHVPFEIDDGSNVLLVSNDSSFLRHGREYIPGARTHLFSYTPVYNARPADEREVRRLAERADYVIFGLVNLNGAQVLAGLEALGDRVIVISALTPIYLSDLPWVETALAVYGWGADSYRAGFSALLGSFEPEGSLPVSLER